MEFVGAIVEIFKCVGPPICKYVEYHRKLDENMQRIISKAQAIEEEVNKGRYFSRARLGKLVEEKIEEAKESHQKGRDLTSISLVIDVPPAQPRGVILPTKTLVGERNKEIVEEIWKHLTSDKITKVGVYGMGGIGKTTIVTLINNKLQKEANKFDRVIWVTVSQALDHIKLQNDIAIDLKENLPQQDKIKRAGKLLQILEGKRFVLILDDMWEAFSIEEVGIPEPTEDNGCKLVITTRSRDVCRSMGCAEVRVQPLTKKEALNLFLDKVGHSLLEVPTLKEIVESIVEECAGLPLAIVTVAGCMKGVDEIHEWRNALNELSGHVRSVRGIDADVFGRLEFSYNRLKDENVQHCFLYCALYPEDFAIKKDELIGYWIAEGILDEVEIVQAKYDRAHTMLDRLVNSCLLENANNGRCVRMHDLIRDMALRITSKSPLFMINAGLNLKKLPSAEEWEENLEKASLIRNEINEIPSNMSPNCPRLSALLLQGNTYLERIPECFFVHMKGLKILDLCYTGIEDLPNSISDLTNLRSLLLQYCARLQRVPSLAKLSALQNLDLRETGIQGVPKGLEMLKNLVYLDLASLGLQEFPDAILPNLHCLSKLRVYFGPRTLPKTVEEAAKLSNQLGFFYGRFCTLDDFNVYVKSLGRRGPKNYDLLLDAFPHGPERLTLSVPPFPVDRLITLGPLITLDKVVSLFCCRIDRTENYNIVLPKDVQGLLMQGLWSLPSLNDIFLVDNEGYGTHSSLREIKILNCYKLRDAFSPQLLSALQNLELIELYRAYEIEEIITLNVNDKEEEEKGMIKKELGRKVSITITLPKLRKLYLSNLISLKSICSDNGAMVCNSLEEIRIENCPKLKRLSLSLPLLDNGEPSPIPTLKEIRIEREIWESLEWDQANTKDILYPCCNFTKCRWTAGY
ncbi:Disease resistance protein [Melia azedarach]|uniref:Disease resistance protein n=1 Tax=Melia azedarach TaxID=155640 RepID=A0ACC1Y667_MELAZ|nr:Disease resistance protein [Melia azedarach]